MYVTLYSPSMGVGVYKPKVDCTPPIVGILKVNNLCRKEKAIFLLQR